MPARTHRHVNGRSTGCAFAAVPNTESPKTRKQAMSSDAPAWLRAEKAEIDNHESNGSWSIIDRSQLPPGRSLVRLIWVYKTKRDGSKKARLCVQSCAQIAS
eukprot:4559492-Pleurochrysis_carterae.AAC.1